MLHATVNRHLRSRAYNRQSPTHQISVESLAHFAHALEPPSHSALYGTVVQESICRIIASVRSKSICVAIAVAATGDCGEALAHDTQTTDEFPFRLARRPSLAMFAGKHTRARAHTHTPMF